MGHLLLKFNKTNHKGEYDDNFTRSNPLLKEGYDIPPREAVSKIMRIAFFVSESVIDVFAECCEKMELFSTNIGRVIH